MRYLERVAINNMFYDWDNIPYSEFMLALLDNLEPRVIEPGVYLIGER